MPQTKNPPRFVHYPSAIDMAKLNDENPLMVCLYDTNPDGSLFPRIVPFSSVSFIDSSSDIEVSSIDLINEFDKLDYANKLENDIFSDSDLL